MDNMASAQELKEEGLRLFQEGLYEEAVVKFEQAQEMFAAEGNDVEVAEMTNNLGVIHRMQGQWDKAIAALEEAKMTFVSLGDRSREAQTLGNLGGLYASKGERDKANECLHRAAGIFAELGDAQRQGETLLALGVQMWKTGDRSDGLATYEAGLQTLQKPTVSQKTLRGLLNVRTRLLGGKKDSD
ncbi:MAG: tetratricopeptide repeat protein [Chloroflexota bacterium]|nr:tetratricopeptide repeat protein [Chloroflexota bacterium]